MKKNGFIGLALVTAFAASIGLTSCGSKGGPTDYTVWIPAEDAAGYYKEYNDNPVVKYIENYMTFNDKSVSFDFTSAPKTGGADDLANKLATGTYYDIMDISMSQQSIVQLYESGAAVDITDYLKKYCPSYIKFYEEDHPELKHLAVTYYDVDGDGELEERYFHLQCSGDSVGEQWSGDMYRRDWIVKYGKFPTGHEKAGQSFTGGYDENGVWTDDVVFPSWTDPAKAEIKEAYLEIDPTWDGTVPVFISDWEWMFDIFVDAMEGEGISRQTSTSEGGYCTSIFYYGYNGVGYLNAAFGGDTTGTYSLNENDEVEFTGNNDNFKAYTEAMNNWYEKGWLDKRFYTRNSDMYFSIDAQRVLSGEVGMFLSYSYLLGDGLVDEQAPHTIGSYVAPARIPINDVYGSGEAGGPKFSKDNVFVPSAYLDSNMDGSGMIITPSALEKDMETLFTFLEYMFDPEKGGYFRMFGLSDEQIAQVKDESWGKVYEENGLTSMGTWGEDGLFYWTDKLVEDTTLRTALICQRLPSRACSSKQALVGTPEYIQAQSEWRIYENTAYGKVEWLANYLSSEDSRKYSIATANLQDYTTKNVYKFITGEKNLDSDWSNYVGMIDKYGAKDFETKFNELRKELLG